MINDHIMLQSHLILFRKTCYIVRNSKKKNKLSPPFPSQTLNPNTPLVIHEVHDFTRLKPKIKDGCIQEYVNSND